MPQIQTQSIAVGGGDNPSPETSATIVIRIAATSMTLVMYSSAPTPERACLEKSQYAVQVKTLATANRSPQPLNAGVPADPIATTRDAHERDPTNTRSRRSTRSPNHWRRRS